MADACSHDHIQPPTNREKTSPNDKVEKGHSCTTAKSLLFSDGLAYLFQRHIIYRDLKPENGGIGTGGCRKLLNLAFSKMLGATYKIFTHCGTPLYAPREIILGQGYGYGIDHWALGILVDCRIHTATSKRNDLGWDESANPFRAV
jgi:serine/threonine protein kinase